MTEFISKYVTFNEYIWICYIAGTIINALAKDWHFDLRQTIGNFVVALLAWVTTQIFIINEPQTVSQKIAYALCCVAFGFAPLQVYKWIAEGGLKRIWNWVQVWRKGGGSVSKQTETEITTIKETETINQDDNKQN